MIPYQNYEVIASVLFYIVSKILGYCIDYRRIKMHNKRQPTLTSIPENSENVEVTPPQKWVPKKKHEVLKAKYKCLKKLFQIYDASVIGILPDQYSGQGDGIYNEEDHETPRRTKVSHRPKHDACAGTSEISIAEETRASESISPIQVAPKSNVQTLSDCNDSVRDVKYASTQDSRTNVSTVYEEKECECTQTKEPLQVSRYPGERRKPTRFQCFLQRLFGLRRERSYNDYCLGSNHVYALSDNNINSYGRGGEKRRRRGLRFRRTRRLKKNQSEIALREVGSPAILSYVQSVQRNCLCDTTPRQCPIIGCRMMFYGIINYNDHLNLCHFTERKYICHYCHEGFEKELHKFLHENEHIGISKLNPPLTTSFSTEPSKKSEMITQTDPESPKPTIQEDKLKRIMSFFDRIANSDQVIADGKKNRYSDSNITKTFNGSDESSSSEDAGKKFGLTKPERDKDLLSGGSDSTLHCGHQAQVKCHFCGEKFNFRRQLTLHVDLEHRVHDKFSKFHSCAGIVNQRPKTLNYISEDGQLNVESVSERDSFFNNLHRDTSFQETRSDISGNKSDTLTAVSGDPSTNVIYCNSKELASRNRSNNNKSEKSRTKVHYNWEPGNEIIHV